jgi:high-affinity Fe2+/Pb2+ permease
LSDLEVAAANLGAAIVPGLVGLSVERYGLASVPVVLFIAGWLVWASLERLRSASAGDPAALRHPAA